MLCLQGSRRTTSYHKEQPNINIILVNIFDLQYSDCTFTATSNEVFVVSSKAGVDGVEALGHALVFPHQHPVLKVPQVHSLQKVVDIQPITCVMHCIVFVKTKWQCALEANKLILTLSWSKSLPELLHLTKLIFRSLKQ